MYCIVAVAVVVGISAQWYIVVCAYAHIGSSEPNAISSLYALCCISLQLRQVQTLDGSRYGCSGITLVMLHWYCELG
jgi:hypothetical protein